MRSSPSFEAKGSSNQFHFLARTAKLGSSSSCSTEARASFRRHWIVATGRLGGCQYRNSRRSLSAQRSTSPAIYTVSRKAAVGGHAFELQLGEQLLGRAVKNSVFRPTRIGALRSEARLARDLIWRRGLNVFEGAAAIGRLEPRGLDTTMIDDRPPTNSMPVFFFRCFCSQIALVLWRRADRAAAS